MLITNVNILCFLLIQWAIFEKYGTGLFLTVWRQKSITVDTECDDEKTERPLKL